MKLLTQIGQKSGFIYLFLFIISVNIKPPCIDLASASPGIGKILRGWAYVRLNWAWESLAWLGCIFTCGKKSSNATVFTAAGMKYQGLSSCQFSLSIYLFLCLSPVTFQALWLVDAVWVGLYLWCYYWSEFTQARLADRLYSTRHRCTLPQRLYTWP